MEHLSTLNKRPFSCLAEKETINSLIFCLRKSQWLWPEPSSGGQGFFSAESGSSTVAKCKLREVMGHGQASMKSPLVSSSDTQVHWVSQMREHQVKLFMDGFQRLKQPGGNCLLWWFMRSQCYTSQSSGRHTDRSLSHIKALIAVSKSLWPNRGTLSIVNSNQGLAQEYHIERQHPSEGICVIYTQNSLLHLHCSEVTQGVKNLMGSTRQGGYNLPGCEVFSVLLKKWWQ